MGVSISGSSRSGRLPKATRPSTVNKRLITVAKTGRLTEISESNMSLPRRRRSRRGTVAGDGDLCAVAQAHRAFHHHAVAGGKAGTDLHDAFASRTDLHLDLF